MRQESSVLVEGREAPSSAIGQISRACRPAITFARRYPVGAASALVILAVAVIAVAAPLVAPHDPSEVRLREARKPPSSQFILGTDYQGRDIFSRIVFGSRASLQVAVLSVLVGTTLGAVLGIASAFKGGAVDLVSQRILEIFMSFPALLLAMLLLVAVGPGIWTVIIAIGVTRMPYGVRVIRSVALSVRESTYVEAARAIGASDLRIMALHIAPQCIAPYLILVSAHLGVAIVIEASLGFIGAGIPEPTPTWGNMLGGGASSNLIPLWWLVVFPGVAISLTVLAFSLLGDALRDVLDPKMRGR
jgi:ABC-type dipeptide/oligopeptide/nickel transport system permease subunit